MEKRMPANLISIVNIVTGIVEVLISLRIILKLFGANSASPFVTWVYQTTAPLLHPFEGMFPTSVLDGIFVIEFSSLFALIAYSLASYLLIEFVLRTSSVVNNNDEE